MQISIVIIDESTSMNIVLERIEKGWRNGSRRKIRVDGRERER